jgi:hypothetical protein
MPLLASSLQRVILVAGLSGIFPALAVDERVQAEIQRISAHLDSPSPPGAANFSLTFDTQFMNRSDKDIYLPSALPENAGVARVAVLAVQVRRSDGVWEYLVRSSWYDAVDAKYEPCRSVPAGETAEIRGVVSGIMLLKKQLAGLGSEPTLRFQLTTFCRQSDGKVLNISATTDGFQLRFPE